MNNNIETLICELKLAVEARVMEDVNRTRDLSSVLDREAEAHRTLIRAVAEAAGGYDAEPDECVACGDDGRMALRKVHVSGRGIGEAWICDECGYPHEKKGSF